MALASNSNESYCTFTLASDVTAGGLPSEADIAKDLESNDDNVRSFLSIAVDLDGSHQHEDSKDPLVSSFSTGGA